MRSTAITQASGGVLVDRNIALELVYATEAAATSAQPCRVGGDKNAADAAAVDAMRACLSTVDIAGRIVTQHSQSRIGLGLAAIGRPADITVGRAADLGDPS